MSILEKFNQIEVNFNKNYLLNLHQILQIVEGDEGEKETRQAELLSEAYEEWYNKLQDNPRCIDSVVAYYNAVGEGHELLMKRDRQLFTLYGDFLSNAFNKPGLDTDFLFDQLLDGLDDVDESTPEEERDAKDNFWNMAIGLYRLTAMICIYLKMPLVREIIDMLLMDNPNLNQSNMFANIFAKFKGSKRLRRMIMKLMKSKEDNFGEIFTSLQKVIATFSSEVNLDTNMKANLEAAKQRVRAAFEQILVEAEVKSLTDAQTTQLIEALEEQKEDALKDFVSEGILAKEKLEKVRELYKAKNLDKMQVNKVVKDLGKTMTDMMAAIETNDEKAIESLLSRAGSGLNLPTAELEKMQSEMEKLEKIDEEDDDDEEEAMPELVSGSAETTKTNAVNEMD